MRTKSIKAGIKGLRSLLYHHGYPIQTETWQGKEKPPVFIEYLHAQVIMPMLEDLEALREETGASLPWADLHFEERVSGKPLNPPPSHKLWLKDTDKYLSEGQKFSHSYPERMWPKGLLTGIRFEVADLNTAVRLLKEQPLTRQCYIPLYFPEDLTASIQKERVPCTLGWHFMLRGDKLHCFYPMRSCDAVRHFHNDIYLANRLCLWLIEKAGLKATPGDLAFHATSFHCFENDRYTLGRLIK